MHLYFLFNFFFFYPNPILSLITFKVNLYLKSLKFYSQKISTNRIMQAMTKLSLYWQYWQYGLCHITMQTIFLFKLLLRWMAQRIAIACWIPLYLTVMQCACNFFFSSVSYSQYYSPLLCSCKETQQPGRKIWKCTLNVHTVASWSPPIRGFIYVAYKEWFYKQTSYWSKMTFC